MDTIENYNPFSKGNARPVGGTAVHCWALTSSILVDKQALSHRSRQH